MTTPDDQLLGQNLDDLAKRFAVPGVRFEAGEGNLVRATISTEAATAHVYLHGAHVTHYQPRGGADVMFLSRKSYFVAGKAIRGGVPIIFPWFGPKADDPSAPAHGVARTTDWVVADVTSAGEAGGRVIRLTLALSSSPATRARWPYEFELLYTVMIGHGLELELHVKNVGSAPFTFEEALHTYLAVGDVRGVSIDGLGGRDYLDKPDGAKLKTQPPGPFGIGGETDRVYLDTPDTVTINDSGSTGGAGPTPSRVLSIAKEGSAATVVWNPWVARAKALSDFGDDEWPAMLCIETANVARHAVALGAGQNHTMRAVIEAR